MNRIAYMVIRNIFRVPIWFYNIWKFGKSEDSHSEDQRYGYLRKIVKKINKTGRVIIECSGMEYLPKENGFILFPNHQGLFDMLALIEACPNPFGVVVKKEASNIILVKQVIALMRGISIDRSDLRASMEVINKMSEEVKRGRNFVIFPEGTRSHEGNKILPFKGGTFKSALKAKCPIVPVALINSFKPFDINTIKRETVQVRFLKPIYPEQYVDIKTLKIADLVHDRIQEEILVTIHGAN